MTDGTNEDEESIVLGNQNKQIINCSFCGRTNKEVNKMIVCDDDRICVYQYFGILLGKIKTISASLAKLIIIRE